MEIISTEQIVQILNAYDTNNPQATADDLRNYWLQFEPKDIHVIKMEDRKQQETVGIPVPVLKSIGKEIGKIAKKNIADFLPLTQILWDEYGREGRVVALTPLGMMELSDPETTVPILLKMCRTCITWEDSDRMAIDALEPIVRKEPNRWLKELETWIADKNKWVKRSGAIVAGRLPMKHPEFAEQSLKIIEPLLLDQDKDVQKGVSFAIRLVTYGDVQAVKTFLLRHIPPKSPLATWVLCDITRKMAKKILPEMAELLPHYRNWSEQPSLDPKNLRSIESAIKVLQKACDS